MFARKFAAFAARDYDAEAIARIKACSLWSHVEFVFHDDDGNIRARMARIATMLFWASETHRNLPYCVTRVEDKGGRLMIHWEPPGPPDGWRDIVYEAWRRAGGTWAPYFTW